MQYKKMDNLWFVVLRKGERIVEKLKEFLQKENINTGYFTGIGAVSSVELAHYSMKEKKYNSRKFDEPLEIVNLSGNIAMKGDERVVHCHISVGNVEMQVFGGHLIDGIVSATCEIIVSPIGGIIERKKDSLTELFLFQFFNSTV